MPYTDYKEKYVAFLDILGFSDIISRLNADLRN